MRTEKFDSLAHQRTNYFGLIVLIPLRLQDLHCEL
jgi:hypothetical protein